MTQKEIDRHDVIQRLIKKEFNGTQAAELLKLSVRQVRRLKDRVVVNSARGLIHLSRGKKSNHSLPKKERKNIVKLLKKHYQDFGPTFASEKLSERDKIDRDPKTIRSIMIAEDLWKPKKSKTESHHRAWRQRRSAYGEMNQYDGSYEHWFEDRGGEVCLLAGIDDATGKIIQASFAPHEGLVPTFTFWKSYVEAHGKPRAIYTDKFSTYKMNSTLAKENHDLKTQFERVCDDLHIELIHANSPQAKGRVERLFRTLQDRLIKELRLAGIATVPEANVFLNEVFIPSFNAKFSVEPASNANLNITLTTKEHGELFSIFSRHETRTIQNDFTISYKNTWYQLEKDQPITVCKKEVVTVEEWIDDTIHLKLRGKELNKKVLPERPKKSTPQPWVLTRQPQQRTKPASDHPWRKPFLVNKTFIPETRTVLNP